MTTLSNLEIAKEICKTIVFITCMYFGFKYGSGWAFVGAVLAFMAIGNK